MSHSKSTSGIKHFDSAAEWKAAISKLNTTLCQYNTDHGTSYKFDVDRLNSIIDNPQEFVRLQNEALAVREGDAMAAVVMRDGGILMQNGNVAYTKIIEYRQDYDTPVLPDIDSERSKIIDVVKSGGIATADASFVENAKSASIHI